MSIYKTLYNQKRLLKSESMKLLDKAFEDFSTEIFLLVQELHALEHAYSQIVVKKPSCSAYQEKVQLLRDLEAKLGMFVFFFQCFSGTWICGNVAGNINCKNS